MVKTWVCPVVPVSDPLRQSNIMSRYLEGVHICAFSSIYTYTTHHGPTVRGHRPTAYRRVLFDATAFNDATLRVITGLEEAVGKAVEQAIERAVEKATRGIAPQLKKELQSQQKEVQSQLDWLAIKALRHNTRACYW